MWWKDEFAVTIIVVECAVAGDPGSEGHGSERLYPAVGVVTVAGKVVGGGGPPGLSLAQPPHGTKLFTRRLFPDKCINSKEIITMLF